MLDLLARKWTIVEEGISGVEVTRVIQIGNQAGMRGFPSELLLGLRARGRIVNRGEMREPAKMPCCLLGGLRDNRNVQSPSNHAGDFSKWHTAIRNAVIRGAGGSLFDYEPVKMRGVEPVHRGPEILPVAHIS